MSSEESICSIVIQLLFNLSIRLFRLHHLQNNLNVPLQILLHHIPRYNPPSSSLLQILSQGISPISPYYPPLAHQLDLIKNRLRIIFLLRMNLNNFTSLYFQFLRSEFSLSFSSEWLIDAVRNAVEYLSHARLKRFL